MTDLELYARARVAFVGHPEARLCTRRDSERRAVLVLAEDERPSPFGRRLRVAVAVGDELLYRDEERGVDRVLALAVARYRTVTALHDAAAAVSRLGRPWAEVRAEIASAP